MYFIIIIIIIIIITNRHIFKQQRPVVQKVDSAM